MNRGVTSGRTIEGRGASRSAYCQGCQARLMVGEPKASASWPSLLMLTPDQCALLLSAGAEYHDLSQKAGEPESVVAFLDWAFVDALRAKVPPPPDPASISVAAGEGDSVSSRRWGALFIALCFLAIAATARAGCEPYPVGPDSPTGIKGCEVYGTGTASMWGGPGIARNDCVWPWDACQPITITSLDSGLTITVTPSMYCDCYTGTSDERIVDLDPASVAALGLDASRGLWSVTVTPLGAVAVLPDTRMVDR